MASYSTSLKTWGATGQAYPNGYNYVEGEQPVDAWDNFFNSNVVSDIDHLISLTNDRIESDKGTAASKPGSPESSHLYYETDNERLAHYDAGGATWRDLAQVRELVDLEDDGSQVYTGLSTLNFGALLDVTDNGSGKVTVDGTDTRTDISDGGTQVVADTTDVNFTWGISASDDGDGTVTAQVNQSETDARYAISAAREIYVQSTAPSSPNDKDLWVDTS